jgi:thioredoxin 1|tara:strand:- start:17714 stop:18031 length:318 start_codon:yes stop_codon:yes gene_type:complete
MSIEITSEKFDSLLSEKEVVVVDFWAPWCGPCRTLGPIVESVDETNTDETVAIVKINVDEEAELAKEYGIRSIPTMIYFKAGEVARKTVGIKSKVEIEGIIDELK